MTADLDWFRELLGSLGAISVRRMFGGAGFYADGRMIALEADGDLYLKTDDQTRTQFAEAGGSPFVYDGKGKSVVMSYWTVPDEAMDSAEGMRPWAMLALEAAVRAGAAKKSVGKGVAAGVPVSKKSAPKTTAPNTAAPNTAAPNTAAAKRMVKKKTVQKKIAKKTVSRNPSS
jgi:DNA transformation protein and related proteins